MRIGGKIATPRPTADDTGHAIFSHIDLNVSQGPGHLLPFQEE